MSQEIANLPLPEGTADENNEEQVENIEENKLSSDISDKSSSLKETPTSFVSAEIEGNTIDNISIPEDGKDSPVGPTEETEKIEEQVENIEENELTSDISIKPSSLIENRKSVDGTDLPQEPTGETNEEQVENASPELEAHIIDENIEIPEDIANLPEEKNEEQLENIIEENVEENQLSFDINDSSSSMENRNTFMRTEIENLIGEISFSEDRASLREEPTQETNQEEMESVITEQTELSVDKTSFFLESLIDVDKIDEISTPQEPNKEMETDDIFSSHIPFNLKWSFGTDIIVPILNLTNENRSEFFVTASQAGIIYDYKSQEMTLLQGHKNLIIDTSCDETGTWLVSIDDRNDGTIMIWDSRTYLPVRTIYNSHPYGGMAKVAISANAKYLVVIGVNFRISLWLWTYGRDKPEDVFQTDPNYGKPKKIHFHPQIQEYIMIVFQRQVLFFFWDEELEKLRLLSTPEIRHKKLAGFNTDGTYIGKAHECVTCTNTGCIIVFGSTSYVQSLEEAPIDNRKIFVKVLKISNSSYTNIQYIDDVLAVGDSKGLISFFDKRIRLLYWLDFNLPAIINLSFHLEEREYEMVNVLDLSVKIKLNINNLFDCLTLAKDKMFEDIFKNDEYEDRRKVETIYYQTVPKDATLNRLPIVVRDFLVFSSDGIVSLVNFLDKSLQRFLSPVTHAATSVTTHDECPHIIIAYENGRICMFNYETHQLIADHLLGEEKDKNGEKVRTTYIKLSPQGLFLCVAQSNGKIWMLDPILLEKKHEEAFQYSYHSIEKICFSTDLQYFAYYDVKSTVNLFYFELEKNEWKYIGKVRGHYKPINDIIFSPYFPSRLFTIGQDRYLVEYNLNPQNSDLTLIQRERIEQSAIPNCFIFYPKVEGVEYRYVLVADNQFKLKWLSDVNLMCRSTILAPSHGCYASSPLQKIAILPKSNDQYLIFANNNYIGIQKLPANGSPYKYIGTVGHPGKLINFELSYDGKYIFTNGLNDTCVLMWEINLASVEELDGMAGKELEPFYPIIPGGLHGWLFKEMQDLFYYMQILHQGENTVLPRIVRDDIPISLLPDLVRACGFYPTEYELENLMVDIRYRDFDKTGNVRRNILFYDFVILFINHRPAHAKTLEELEQVFDTICNPSIGNDSLNFIIETNVLINTLMTKGEQMTNKEVFKCLFSLTHQDENIPVQQETKNFNFLPQIITFQNLVNEILGLQLQNENENENENE